MGKKGEYGGFYAPFFYAQIPRMGNIWSAAKAKLRAIRNAVVTPGVHPSDPNAAYLFGGRPTSSGQYVTSDTAMRVSAVYACVTVLAQTVAMLPKDVKGYQPDGSKKTLPNHRLQKQIKFKPNRWQTSFEFFEMLEGHRLLRGNAYALLSSTPGRGVNEMVPLNPDRMYPFVVTPEGTALYLSADSDPPPAGSALWYQYASQTAGLVTLSASEVLHVRGFSHNGVVGINPIRYARESIGLAMATEEHGARVFSNGAQISKAFKHPGKLGDVAYDRLKKSLGGEFSGVSNAHKTIILEEGMDVSPLSMTAEDAQFLETRKFQVEDIARIFNVPLILIGHSDKASTYASAEQFFMSFQRHTLAPLCERWEQAMDRDLLYPAELGSVSIEFDMKGMMRGDSAARVAYYKGRFEVGSLNGDEIRAMEDENPTGTEGGKKYFVMSNMIPTDQAGMPQETTP